MAARPERGEVDLRVGDKTYTLVMKLKGFMAVQKHFSTPGKVADIDEIVAEAMRGSIEHAVALVWGSFQKYHPDLTMDDVVDIIDEAGGLLAIEQQLAAIRDSSAADPEDLAELGDAPANPLPAQAARGTSGRSRSRVAAPA